MINFYLEMVAIELLHVELNGYLNDNVGKNM